MHLKDKKALISGLKLAYRAGSDKYYVEFRKDGSWSFNGTLNKHPGSTVFKILNMAQIWEHGWFNFGLHFTILINLWAIEKELDSLPQ